LKYLIFHLSQSHLSCLFGPHDKVGKYEWLQQHAQTFTHHKQGHFLNGRQPWSGLFASFCFFGLITMECMPLFLWVAMLISPPSIVTSILKAEITQAPIIEGRAVATNGPDFIGYSYGTDFFCENMRIIVRTITSPDMIGLGTPYSCESGYTLTTVEKAIGCCATTTSICALATRCSSGTQIRTWLGTVKSDFSRCFLPGDLCKTQLVYEGTANENPLSLFRCQAGFPIGGKVYRRSLSVDATS
jgi:hypothetical protein